MYSSCKKPSVFLNCNDTLSNVIKINDMRIKVSFPTVVELLFW